jgi:hypothetical protein
VMTMLSPRAAACHTLWNFSSIIVHNNVRCVVCGNVNVSTVDYKISVSLLPSSHVECGGEVDFWGLEVWMTC